MAPLQKAYKTAGPEVRPSAAALREPATATSWTIPGGQRARPGRPHRRRRTRPASCAAGAGHGHGHVPGSSAPVLAAGSAAASTHRRRHCVRLLRRCRPRRRRPPWPHPARSLASLFWTASSPLQSPQVAPAAATSASALQASKYYSRKADESILLGWGGVYVTVACNLEFCTNVRSPCNVPPRVAEVWCMGHKAIRVRIYVSVFVTSQKEKIHSLH